MFSVCLILADVSCFKSIQSLPILWSPRYCILKHLGTLNVPTRTMFQDSHGFNIIPDSHLDVLSVEHTEYIHWRISTIFYVPWMELPWQHPIPLQIFIYWFQALLCLVLKKDLDSCDISSWKYYLVPRICPNNILGTSEWLITSQLVLNPHKGSFSHSLGSPKCPFSTYIPHFASVPCLWIPMPTNDQYHTRLAFWGSVPRGASMPRPYYLPNIVFLSPPQHLCSVIPNAVVKCSSHRVPALSKT